MKEDENIDACLDQLEQELRRLDCDCREELLDVRRRTFGNGSQHLVLQCLYCGRQRGNALGAKAAATRLEGRDALVFDDGIAEKYKTKRSGLIRECWDTRAQRDPESVAWAAREQEKRQEQTQRVSALVDECAQALVIERGEVMAANALANKAISMRSKLRDELFASTPCFSTEAELKQWLTAHLVEDFDLFPEVPGRHVAEGVTVQIDYLAYPRPHLLAAGFLPSHFGIEVKHLNQADGFSHKAARALWQTVSYTDAEFSLDGRTVRPKFALLFTNISFDDELRLLNHLGEECQNDRALWRGLQQLANHANVGTLEILGTRDAWRGWRMTFGGGLYFRRGTSDGGAYYHLSNARMVEKIRIGNF